MTSTWVIRIICRAQYRYSWWPLKRQSIVWTLIIYTQRDGKLTVLEYFIHNFIFGVSFWFLLIQSFSTVFKCNLVTPCVKESTKHKADQVPVISWFYFKIFSILSSQFFIRIRILSLWRQNKIVLSLRSWKKIAYIW